MLTLSSPVLPLLDAPDVKAELLAVIGRAAPLLIPSSLVSSLSAEKLSLLSSYLVQADASISSSQAADLLDGGADAIVLSANDASTFLDGEQPLLPLERVVLSLDSTTAASLPAYAEKGLAGVIVTLPEGVAIESSQAGDIVGSFASVMKTKDTGRPVYVAQQGAAAPTPKTSDAARLFSLQSSLIVPTSQLSLDSSRLDFVDAFLSPLQSDRKDGLFPTNVVAAALLTSLGLVYSSRESLRESLLTGSAVYQSRTRGLWRKGASSGATQEVVRIRMDCDADALEFKVRQRKGTTSAAHAGFCHQSTKESCFGPLEGLAKLEATLKSRKESAPKGSYTARIFSDEALLAAKIREEATELVDAKDEDKEHVAFEAADLLYFALARCVRAGVSLEDVERSLDVKAKKVTRRKGDAKPQFTTAPGAAQKADAAGAKPVNGTTAAAPPAAVAASSDPNAPILMQSYIYEDLSTEQRAALLKRPAIKTEATMELVRPILKSVKERGDAAVLELTAKFDRAQLTSTVRRAPYATPDVMAKIKPEVKTAIDRAYANIYKFHHAQKVTGGNKPASAVGASGVAPGTGEGEDDAVLEVETMPGVVCRRFARPIQRVGLYVPGGTAVLPSTALMLGIPAQIAGCPTIVLATPPRPDGSIAPEVLYVADKVGATALLCAGGAQAVGAMAYGTESCPKVDKIFGPGNQFVTAAKMLVQNDVDALVSIDMPAGPSEVLVIADEQSNPDFVASDLLSQAEHGPDSQVVLVGIALTKAKLQAIEASLDKQAKALPRCEIVRRAIEKSVTVVVPDAAKALEWSNAYAPEHLILQCSNPEVIAKGVLNAGSVFIGPWTPESVGDYASGSNHSLPTFGYARQFSGVSTGSFQKHITAQSLTEEGLKGLGPHVVALAECEGLEAHAEAVRIRLAQLKGGK
ncbi:hypothetical protein BDZ90DRAFT_231814 [Jaminaea rosea]|uniref:Histidine biosynthesis trifunctional protein n=1 Tax=Jaminaea rosea TaxID=1569628 RepID=A0A316UUP7_9BASI|nr:hypothetical protein BDZ90DRAFT_231814 [Jaminaea rosea]PWN28051.1 hypothetical protein BDZ90DRAFT_231814 [Jaminaea rosea]